MAVHPGDHLVAIPCFNHQKEVGEVVRGALRYVPADWIAVVDDGSVPPLQPAHVCGALLLRHEQHRGLSAAIATAVRHALTIGADGLIKLDADGQMDTEALPCFRAAMDEGYELVLGTFDPALTPSLELFADGLFRLLFRLGTGCSVPTVLADYRAYGPDALRVLGPRRQPRHGRCPWHPPLRAGAGDARDQDTTGNGSAPSPLRLFIRTVARRPQHSSPSGVRSRGVNAIDPDRPGRTNREEGGR